MSAVVTTDDCVMRFALYCEPISFTTAAQLPKRGKRTGSAAESPGGMSVNGVPASYTFVFNTPPARRPSCDSAVTGYTCTPGDCATRFVVTVQLLVLPVSKPEFTNSASTAR